MASQYTKHLNELESILQSLDDPQLEIETLETKVARAMELLGLCRSELEGIQGRISGVLEQDLSEPPTD
jgi:exodeoxyribonuclease VII small subunit